MSFVSDLVCVACGAVYPEGKTLTCPACGPAEGILEVRYDLAGIRKSLTPAALADRPPSIWRYKELLPLSAAPPAALASIGWTPLIEAPHLAQALGVRRVRLKNDGRSMSGSFKDRASAVGVARAIEEGYRAIACAATGNGLKEIDEAMKAVGKSHEIPPDFEHVERIVKHEDSQRSGGSD